RCGGVAISGVITRMSGIATISLPLALGSKIASSSCCRKFSTVMSTAHLASSKQQSSALLLLLASLCCAIPCFPRKKPPAKWTGFRTGAYWTANSRLSAPFVRTFDDEVQHAIRVAWAKGTLQPHINAVNVQQAVPWKIDERMLDVVKHFGPYNKPDDDPLFRADIQMAEALQGEAFYLAKNVDWRGRFYGIPFFNFERQDWVRSLFRFDRGHKLGDEGLYWLKIHTATTGDFRRESKRPDKWQVQLPDGSVSDIIPLLITPHESHRISKRPFSERIAWVDENLDMIRKAAANPIETYDWWGQAGKKKKYQFLAACIELSEALRLERPEE